jgi:hypothetical protein
VNNKSSPNNLAATPPLEVGAGVVGILRGAGVVAYLNIFARNPTIKRVVTA